MQKQSSRQERKQSQCSDVMKVSVALAIVVVCLSIATKFSSAGEDYYKVLGVPRDASLRQIKKAYREMSLKYHPDKNKGNEEAARKFAEINNAYEVLKDDEKRRIYDQFGEEGLRNNAGASQHGGFGWPFDAFFRQDRGHQGMRQGASIRMTLEATLEDLYLGKTVKVAQKRQILCQKCRGLGTEKPEDMVTCPVCKGRGVRTVVQQMGPGFTVQTQTTCDHCGGKGKMAHSTCPHCGGTKVETSEEVLTIFIEKGMKDGDTITFERQADEAPETTPGDLVFVIQQQPHSTFTRNGNDLHTTKSISLLEALVGFETSVRHLDGRKVPIKRTEITTPGFVLEIPDEGMPVHEWNSERGSLFVKFSIRFPVSLTEEQKQGFRDILKT